MEPAFRLTDRDRQITRALCVFARLFNQHQISDFWFNGDKANARRRLRQLIGNDMLKQVAVRARPLPPLEQPVISWHPGDTSPDFAKAAYQLRSRWIRRPVKTQVPALRLLRPVR